MAKNKNNDSMNNENNKDNNSTPLNGDVCMICGRHRDDVKLLFKSDVSDDMCICNDCVEQLHMLNMSIHAQHRGEMSDNTEIQDVEPNECDDFVVNYDFKIMTPHEIKEKLDEYVIGQDEAKKTLAVAVYNHYKRITQPDSDDNVLIDKSNCTILGNSGVGKCVSPDTYITVRNKKTGVVENLTIRKFKERF